MLIHVIMHRCLSVVARQPLLPTHIETIIPIDSAESTTRSQLVARLDQMISAPGPSERKVEALLRRPLAPGENGPAAASEPRFPPVRSCGGARGFTELTAVTARVTQWQLSTCA